MKLVAERIYVSGVTGALIDHHLMRGSGKLRKFNELCVKVETSLRLTPPAAIASALRRFAYTFVLVTMTSVRAKTRRLRNHRTLYNPLGLNFYIALSRDHVEIFELKISVSIGHCIFG